MILTTRLVDYLPPELHLVLSGSLPIPLAPTLQLPIVLYFDVLLLLVGLYCIFLQVSLVDPLSF